MKSIAMNKRIWQRLVTAALCSISLIAHTEELNPQQRIKTAHFTQNWQQTYRVGPSSPYKKPSDLARLAKNASLIEIEAGDYRGDVAVWRQHNLTFRGINGRAHLMAKGQAAEGKATWVIKGNNTVIENIEFSGSKVPSRNGAGIRMEGTHLTLRNCYFHDNEMGILTGKNLRSDILIENSEFSKNTVDYKKYGKLGHNIYIGEIRKFTLTGSYIHDAETGHNVKSRAHENNILYNLIIDEQYGSSYLVDLPNGGNSSIIGNIFHQSPLNDNNTLLSYSAERNQDKTTSTLYVGNNTLVNSAKNATFIKNHSLNITKVINNLLVGRGKVLDGQGLEHNNIQLAESGFKNTQAFNFRAKPTMQEIIDLKVQPERTKNNLLLNPASH